MTPPSPSSSPLAGRVAEKLRAPGPWEVYADHLRRYEVHFNGRVIELVRGPLFVEGYGIRVFRSKGEGTGTGFQASIDSSEQGIAQAVESAESIATRSSFPAKRVELPADRSGAPGGPEIVDQDLWDAPIARLEEYVTALLAPFDAIRDVVPSFGSVRATLAETSIANSAGLRASFPHTTVALEVALKAFGGPEGAPPGEYWVNDLVRRLEPAHAGDHVADWARFAQDARRAKAPPSGELPIVFPAEVVLGILPSVIGFRFSGVSRLRRIAPEPGTQVGMPEVNLSDDGTIPWGTNSAPVDDEGTRMARRALVQKGAASELLYDLLHAGAFEHAPTGNGLRGLTFGTRDWLRFAHEPAVGSTTLDLEAGTGGSDAELIEQAGDGIWVQQLGWASPDPTSGAFGGEIRIGYRIRNGKLAEPLRGGTVGGTVLAEPGAPSMLANIAALGSKSTLLDGFRGPTVLVKPLTVAGV
jgi:TldD protein